MKNLNLEKGKTISVNELVKDYGIERKSAINFLEGLEKEGIIELLTKTKSNIVYQVRKNKNF